MSAYSKQLLSAVADRLANSPTATDEDILPAVKAAYPDITVESLRPGLIELGDNWLEVDGSGNTETVTVTGIKRTWSPDAHAGDVAEGEHDPGRE